MNRDRCERPARTDLSPHGGRGFSPRFWVWAAGARIAPGLKFERTSRPFVFLSWVALLAFGAPPNLLGWTHELYVWQRAPGPAVTQALQRFAPQVAGFNVLVAEVTWRAGKPEIVRPPADFAALARLGRPVGLSLRVGAFRGAFSDDDPTARALGELARACLATARAGGLQPAELQVDFDCAESKLAGYRAWLVALKRAAGETPLVFTALPSWLKHETEFRALAASADGFVLQVHSLEKPNSPDAAFSLCDPARAVAWARTADTFSRPFRIALPTYGYVIAFDRDGKFLGLGAEMQRPNWPRDAQLRSVSADAPAMSGLARELARLRLAHCRGVLWFRLPVAGDRLNWDPATLASVLRGETPRGELAVEVTWSANGLAEVVLVNRGTDTVRWPEQVPLAWTAASGSRDQRPIASDGLAGCALEFPADGRALVRVNNFSTENLLRPGQRVKVAWLRFSHELPLTARVAGHF